MFNIASSTINQIQVALAPIAQKIGEGAGYVWGVVVMQQIVYGYIGLFVAIVGLISFIWVYIATKKFIAKNGRTDGSIACSVILGGGSLVAFIGGIIYAISYLINPAYYALLFFITLGQK